MDTPLSIEETRQAVDAYISQVVAKRRSEAEEIGASYALLWERVDQIITAGGKRIRPYLSVVGYGQLDERIIPVAAAQELIHVAMLVHDDIIDQDNQRHGQKNVNGLYIDTYQPFLDEQRATHYAHSAAILAGDVLISEAYRVVCDSGFDADTKQRVLDQLHNSVFEVIGGELMDVESGFRTDMPFDPMQIYRYKTSSYSFIGPLLSGAYCAGLSAEEITVLESFATNSGIAFQIQDDLLGVFGDEQATGKSTLTDLREGKRTLLIKYHEDSMSEQHRQNFQMFGNADASTDQIEQIKNDMVESGAREKTAAEAERYFGLASESLEKLPAGTRRSSLEWLLSKLQQRER